MDAIWGYLFGVLIAAVVVFAYVWGGVDVGRDIVRSCGATNFVVVNDVPFYCEKKQE